MKNEISLWFGVLSGISYTVATAFQVFKKGSSFSLFREVFYTNETPMAVVGMNKKVLFANQAMEKFLGYSETELRKIEFPTITHPEDVEIDVGLFEEMVAGVRDRYFIRKRWIPKWSDFVSGMLACSAIRDIEAQDGKLLGILAIVTPLEGSSTSMERAVQKAVQTMENNKKDGILNQVVTGLTKMDQLQKPIRIVLLFTVLAGTLYLFFFGGFEDIMDKLIELATIVLKD